MAKEGAVHEFGQTVGHAVRSSSIPLRRDLHDDVAVVKRLRPVWSRLCALLMTLSAMTLLMTLLTALLV